MKREVMSGLANTLEKQHDQKLSLHTSNQVGIRPGIDCTSNGEKYKFAATLPFHFVKTQL
ncbi:hypothetical protein CANARDRAFT_30593 [[Candida] arabinofermentans NRRL YB-2248]|uniref:Uncharacterized protein n=1 Tax=[Candida] arabinofermentans NRRL YB-2248 TaxID=983967 RepID=A0A1E4STH4_9ASCO|nr:hypothetical protein CANARDRAFT_30593 [[Candida] arabinofermentans NRRL YB-2248]